MLGIMEIHVIHRESLQRSLLKYRNIVKIALLLEKNVKYFCEHTEFLEPEERMSMIFISA